MAEISALVTRRGQLKGQLTRFSTYLRNNASNIDFEQLSLRKEKVKEIWEDFNQVQTEIEEEKGLNIESENYRLEFEELYFKNMAECDRMMKSVLLENNRADTLESNNSRSVTACENQIAPPSIKLAALQIPTFSGKYTEWSSFCDIFTALVHDNKSLSDIQKFFYLRSSLSGDAEKSVQCLQTTNENYRKAWKGLIERYSNKRILVQVHTKSLFNLEPLTNESSEQIRKLYDSLSGHIKALETLGQSPSQWGSLFLHLITTKLDPVTLRQWEIESHKLEEVSVECILEYLQSRFRILEAIEATGSAVSTSKDIKDHSKMFKKNVHKSMSLAAINGEIKCFNCKLSHTIYRCPSFLKLSVHDRIKRITELNLCKICLRSHGGDKCYNRRCPKCARSHNGLLHIPSRSITDKVNGPPIVKTDTDRRENETDKDGTLITTVVAHAALTAINNQVLLSTAVITIYNDLNEPISCRALLDSGSQNNFITECMAKYLRLKRKRISYSIVGINQSSHNASYQISAKIKSRLHEYNAYLNFIVMPKLTNYLPSESICTSDVTVPQDIDLADPTFNTPQKIDMIIGSEIFFELICKDQLRPNLSGPIFQKTLFGWVVAGPVDINKKSPIQNEGTGLSLYSSISSVTNLEEQIANFWRLEEIKSKVYSLEEKACKINFENTVNRATDNRFVVSLPFRDDIKLGKSYDIALRRFLSLERRLQGQDKFKRDYQKFMDEYLSLGHMEIVGPEERDSYVQHNYLPHHAVIKESSITTKLRVVFDAACKTDTGISLNDALYKGPSIQEDLVCIMARFRTYKFVISADIVKMYRQIWVAEQDRDRQRILWRSKPDQPIRIYRLKTITYGVVTASFLATGCLQRLAEEEYNRYPVACRAIRQDFYMDDLLSGANTIEDALKLRDDIITVLSSAGFELRKWSSNALELLRGVPTVEDEKIEDCDKAENERQVTKILGLFWNRKNDSYQYKVEPFDNNARITKRNVLSEIASVFDPLGLISPIIVRLKLIMQKLWQLSINWDELLPTELIDEWENSRRDLEKINLLVIDRLITGSAKICSIQIHGFADASIKAYGACLYLRTVNERGAVITSLICAKSRVAPLKVVTLPRLELLAAVLLARLAAKYVPSLQLRIDNTYYWTDSTIVLAWISSPASRWKTFVGHRVSEIQEVSSVSQWRHISTNENPADIVSRGCSSIQIIESKLWWNGPEWLCDENSKWPSTTELNYIKDRSLLEEKMDKIALLTIVDVSILGKYSSLSKLVRVVAYCLRFICNIKPKTEKIIGLLKPSEIERASITIIKLVQLNEWQEEIKQFKGKRPISAKSHLLRLKPLLDENGIIRVGGRLKNAESITIFQKHPIVLPSNSPFTRLIFVNEHETSMHSGPQAMLARVRLKYWPLNGRNIARNVVRRCVKCFRYKPVIVQPIMGDLPKDRIEPARAFIKCGVDFAGPMHIKSSLRRKAPTYKGYVCVWVCFVTKAVHIELVGNLTTEAFLNALNRFFDRRGICTDIYSDNATNFVGANRQLQELRKLFLSSDHQREMQGMLNKIGVRWHFIPPRSPHFGGLWESAIKSVKTHLYRTLGNAFLTYEELYTVLVRVEAILNSRPITPLSSDPTDLAVLTPGHFLIGESMAALPERDMSSMPTNRLTRWRRVTQLTQHIWRRWNREYLCQLQTREKWSRTKGPRLAVGTVVLIRDENLPPLQWKVGRVVSTHQGADETIRVATVRTREGQFKRAVRQLCPLPFEGNEANEAFT